MKQTQPHLPYSLLVVVLLLAGLAGCGGEEVVTVDRIIAGETGAAIDTRLTPYLQKALAAYDLPGLAVGIVQDGRIVYARGFGVESLANPEPVTIHTVFHMASVSKPFVATAIMQLVEKGHIDLDAPVIRYLPYFRLQGDGYRRITVRQMLTHTSGMPDVEDYEWSTPVYDEGALERYVCSLADRQLVHPPGETYRYSNMAFECLGDIIAKVSGLTFADYVQQKILDPCAMTASTFLKPEHLPEGWAAPHLRTLATFTWAGYPYNRMHGPSSTLHSSALDMCRWAEANLNRGVRSDQRILEGSSYDELWRPQSEGGEYGQVGLSWFISTFEEERLIHHGGGDVGFNTQLMLLPERKTAVIVLCNFIPAPVRSLADAALQAALGGEPAPLRPPPASLRVLEIFRSDGLAAAVQTLHSFQQTDTPQYDFSPQQYFWLMETAIALDRETEATELARFIMAILPESIWSGGVEDLRAFAGQHPENRAATAVLQVFESGAIPPSAAR